MRYVARLREVRGKWGQNDKANELVRLDFPKVRDFSNCTMPIAKVVNEINQRPRKKYLFK